MRYALRESSAYQLEYQGACLLPDSAIDAGLVQAFRETDYQVRGAEPFTLRVNEHSAALAAAHKRFRSDCSAFITACNPFSENIGQHPSNQWPGEASYLVFGLKLEAAKTLGRALRQNAIVWSDVDAVPRLILLLAWFRLGRRRLNNAG